MFSSGQAINSSGQVAGQSSTSSGTRAFLWQDDALGMRDLGTLGGLQSWAYAINGSGQVAGSSTTLSGSEHAFLWQDGTPMKDIGTPAGGAWSRAYAINNAGQVVGFWVTTDGATRAFLWQNGTVTDLNDLLPAGSGWVLTEARGINDKGEIVGRGTYNGATRAFLLKFGEK